MRISSFLIYFFSLLPLLFQPSHSNTILVDGFSEWKSPIVHIGDSIIFKHKYGYNLNIFQNLRAFDLCNFTQATLLSKPNTTSYTWHPSRLGYFYFAFNNGSPKACQASQKLAIKVSRDPSSSPPQTSPVAAPAPSSGGVASSSPSFPWPFRPHQTASPSPAPGGASSPVTLPLVPDKGGGIPFINSNPAVPLPTGEVDSATIRPLTTSGHEGEVMIGLLGFQMALALKCLVFLML
ncbi:early nodulin-like protein 1 isoform X2 [Quillaja saponaria]|uniref:Early nodulin-like protein 1 isoform X2 n=1 Tax=Quillaja saponaria TaxID=32244 RepID=A0AAD7M4H2_QUISA|nr:early nodulin-like protein 1 isoform X2 [Quillaja saponaria]